MSSRILLNSFLAPPSIGNKRSLSQPASSEDFTDFVSAVTAREATSEDDANNSSLSDAKRGSAQTRQSLAETANSTGDSAFQTSPGTGTLTAPLSESADYPGFLGQGESLATNYGQGSTDTSLMGKNLLKLIQSVQEGDVPQAQAALGQIARKIANSQALSSTNAILGYAPSNSLQRFVSEMQSALAENDVQGAQANLSSFLESTGQAKGNFIATSA